MIVTLFKPLVSSQLRRAVLALAWSIAALPAVQAQWAQDGLSSSKGYANPVESTLSKETIQGLKVIWERPLSGSGDVSSVSQLDNRMFTCAARGGLFALDPPTGNVLWHQASASLGECGAPAVDHDAVYLSTAAADGSRNVLRAYHPATGAELWSTDLPAGTDFKKVTSGLALNGDMLVVTTQGQAVVAVRRTDGHVMWQSATGTGTNSSPSVANGRVFVATATVCCTTPGSVRAFDLATGELLWTHQFRYELVHPPLVMGDQVIVGPLQDPTMAAFDAADGHTLWTKASKTGSFTSHLSGNGSEIYAVTGGIWVSAYSATNGRLLWHRKYSNTLSVAPALVWANKLLYAVYHDYHDGQVHYLQVFNAHTGNEIDRIDLDLPLAGLGTTVVDGRVVIVDRGRIVVLGL